MNNSYINYKILFYVIVSFEVQIMEYELVLHIINFPSNMLQILQQVERKQESLPSRVSVIAAPTRTSSPSISGRSSPLATCTPATRSTALLVMSSYPVSAKSPLQRTKRSLVGSNVADQKMFWNKNKKGFMILQNYTLVAVFLVYWSWIRNDARLSLDSLLCNFIQRNTVITK